MIGDGWIERREERRREREREEEGREEKSRREEQRKEKRQQHQQSNPMEKKHLSEYNNIIIIISEPSSVAFHQAAQPKVPKAA